MHFVERTDDVENSCDYTPPTKIIRLENNGSIENIHVIESEQEETDNVVYLYLTEEGTILTTNDQQVSNDEESQEQTFENSEEQVIFIEVDENNENYMTVNTEESLQEEIFETDTDEILPTTESATDSKSVIITEAAPTRTVIIKSPPTSSVIGVPEESVELMRCNNNCGSQFIHTPALVRHQNTCHFKDGKTSPALNDFEKLSDEIITYFEVICEKGSRNTVKRKHKWLWQFMKEMLNDPIEFSCVWIDRISGCFEILDKDTCNAKWENYKRVKKMSTVGYGKQEFVACFDWYQKINILREITVKDNENQVNHRYQFHPTFYHDFFEPYKFLTSIPRDIAGQDKLLIPPTKRPIARKPKSPKSPMYCSKKCGSQYINSSALESHEKVCPGVSASTSAEEEILIEKSSEETVEEEAVNEERDIAIVYPTNNKNVVMCSLCRKFWNTTGLRIHMKKAHGLSKIKVQTMDVFSPNKPVTVRFDKVGDVTL